MANAALYGLLTILALAFGTWIVSLVKRDVSIVDSVWSLLILLAAFTYAVALPEVGPRAPWILALATLWAARLAGYITWRNWGRPEDYRYQAIRARNEPGFALRSIYLIFGLQGALAAIVSLPLLAALASPKPVNWLDATGTVVCLFGFLFETVGDWQLARFKSDPANRDRVMDGGLWRYSRHPNYFGEFCVWWGLYLIALGAGAFWTIVSPLLMSLLLLKVSGAALLEKDIAERRPAYREYAERTPAFFPGRPKEAR